MKQYKYTAITLKEIKMLKISFVVNMILITIFAIASISLSIIGMKQASDIKQKDEQIQELTMLVELLKGE